MKLLLRLALAAVLIKFVPLAEGSIAVLHHYRYGEDDAVSSGALGASKDRAGANDLILGSTGPLYSTNVGAEAVARTGSSRSGDYSAQCFSYAALASTATDNFGIETWVKVNASTENRYIVYNGNGSGDGWGLQLTGATFSARFGGVGNFGSAAVQPGVWTHLALVRDSGTATFYVNGVASGSSASVPKVPTNVFTVGGPPPPFQSEFLRGMVDETRIFSFAPGSFSPADLLCRATEVQVEQPAGSVVANGGTVDFGAVATGNQATRTFSIRNAGGTHPVQLASPAVSLSGKHAADYTILAQPSFAEPAVPNAGFEDPGFLPGPGPTAPLPPDGAWAVPPAPPTTARRGS